MSVNHSTSTRGKGVCGVFRNRVLGKNCGFKTEEIMLKLIELHNGKLNNLYSWPHIITAKNSEVFKLAGQVLFTRQSGISAKFSTEKNMRIGDQLLGEKCCKGGKY